MADCDETLRGALRLPRRRARPTAEQDSIRHHLDDCQPCFEAYDFEAELRVVIAQALLRGCHRRAPHQGRQGPGRCQRRGARPPRSDAPASWPGRRRLISARRPAPPRIGRMLFAGRGLALLDRRAARRRGRPDDRGHPGRLPDQGRPAEVPAARPAIGSGVAGADRLGSSPSGSPSGPRAVSRSPSRTTTTRSSPTSSELTARPRTWWPRPPACAASPDRPGPGVTDRAGWVRANIASFQRLLRPVTDRLDERMVEQPVRAGGPAGRPAPRSGSCSAGCRPGCSASTTCWSSRTRTPRTRTSSTTSVPTSWPWRSGSPSRPREFRLWLALHEVTHRAQFTGVPWMREHFLSLVQQTVGAVDPDPKALPGGARSSRRPRSAGAQPARRRRA